jgi:hypothetical protein
MLGGPCPQNPAAPRPRRPPTGLTVRRRAVRRDETQPLDHRAAWHGTFWPARVSEIGSRAAQRPASPARERSEACQVQAVLGGVVLNEQDTFEDYSLVWRVTPADFNRLVLFSKG